MHTNLTEAVVIHGWLYVYEYITITNIFQFSGNPDDVALETFFTRVYTHIANKCMIDGDLKIENHKHNADAEKSKARHVIRYGDMVR